MEAEKAQTNDLDLYFPLLPSFAKINGVLVVSAAPLHGYTIITTGAQQFRSQSGASPVSPAPTLLIKFYMVC